MALARHTLIKSRGNHLGGLHRFFFCQMLYTEHMQPWRYATMCKINNRQIKLARPLPHACNEPSKVMQSAQTCVARQSAH